MNTKVWTAKKIAALRAAAGMTQAQLADWLGVVRTHVTHLESGFRPAGPQTVRLLAWLAEKVKRGEIQAGKPKKRRQAR